MQLVCPKCATSYEVSATTIGEHGRPVRCVRCRNLWHARAPAVETSDAAVAAFQQELGSAPATADAIPPATAIADDPVLVEQALAATAATADVPPPDIETAAAAASLADHPVDLMPPRRTPHDEPAAIMDAPPLVPEAPTPGVDLPPRRRRPARRPPLKPAFDKRMAAVIAGLPADRQHADRLRAEIVRHAPQMASLTPRSACR